MYDSSNMRHATNLPRLVLGPDHELSQNTVTKGITGN